MRKLNKKTSKPILYMLISIISGLISAGIILLLTAFLMSKKDINNNYIKYFWFGIVIIQGLTAGFICGRKFRHKTFLAGAVSGAASGLLDIIIILAVNSFSISIFSFSLLPAITLSGLISAVIASNI